ncbi:MAG: thioredoxin [Puniceicoccales bacterium]|jgi:thioredoxin 1|nr:thioredoxin [Puniceicoccales bacterium]
MLHLNSLNFANEIKSNRLVVVDFWAPWCGPCRALGPIVEQVASEVGPDVAIGKLDIGECPELAEKLGIQSIPTVIFFKDGAEVKRIVGLSTKADILAAIDSM